jgi:hypothetical protein
VPRATVNIAGGIQPGTLSRALSVEHRESGLAARLLLTWPPRRPKEWTEADIDPALETAYAQVVSRLLELQPAYQDDQDYDAQIVRLSPAAKSRWIDYYNEHGREQIDLEGDLSAAWSKLEGYAARLALIIHLAKWATDHTSSTPIEEVDEDALAAGVTLSRWFGAEARRVYQMLEEDDAEREDRKLVEWIHRKGGSVTVRQTQQGHRRLATREASQAALERLVRQGLGRFESGSSGPGGGRPSELFVLSALQAGQLPESAE